MGTQFSQKVLVSSGKFEKERAYWLNKLSQELTFSTFSYKYVAAEVEKKDRKVLRFSLPKTLCSGLLRLGNHSDYGIFIILLAGLNCLLFKYTGNKDIILGAPVFKQEDGGDYFNRTLALRNTIDAGMSFKELLGRVKETVVEANENMNYPFEELKKNWAS